jgi:hypothetical protein
MSSEIDINSLVTIYNQKISSLINENIILEAKLLLLDKELRETKKLFEESNKK